MTMAKVTCLHCGWNWIKDCSFGYKDEKDFYLNYKPECPSCHRDPNDWKIEEIIEVVLPLTDEEKSLFSLAKVTKEAR
jgi:hypothetical protein